MGLSQVLATYSLDYIIRCELGHFGFALLLGGIGLLGILPDLAHPVDGMARQTHLLAILVACIPLCLYDALCSRHAKSRRLR